MCIIGFSPLPHPDIAQGGTDRQANILAILAHSHVNYIGEMPLGSKSGDNNSKLELWSARTMLVNRQTEMGVDFATVDRQDVAPNRCGQLSWRNSVHTFRLENWDSNVVDELQRFAVSCCT